MSAYRILDDPADDNDASLHTVQRRSTMPAKVDIFAPSAMRHQTQAYKSPSFAIGSNRQPTGRESAREAVPDNTSLRSQNPPVIINNFIQGDSSGSDNNRHRRRRRENHYGRRRPESYEDDSDAPDYSRRRTDRSYDAYCVSSLSSDEEDSDNLYSFTPLHSSVPSASLKGRTSSADSHAPFLPTIGEYHARKAKIMHVYRAQYTGDTLHEASHASRLTLLHNPRRPQQALFRWIHVEQSIMSFDAFWHEISGITNLTKAEMSGIKKLLQDVRGRDIRQIVSIHGTHKVMRTEGLKTRRLQPQSTGASTTSRHGTVHWINLPFFELKKYSSEKLKSDLFPSQTLTQVDYSQHLMARDMQQAVRQINEGPEDHCFHISQLWAIVINNSLLVTCSTMSDKLGDDRIEMKNVPPEEKGGDGDELRIQVEYRENTLWALPLRECSTWFEFITHFWEFWPENIQFYRNGKLLTSNDWTDIVESAQHGNSKVLLEAMTKPLPRPPTQGLWEPIVGQIPSDKRPDADSKGTKKAEGASKGSTTVIPSASTTDELSHGSSNFSVLSWLQSSSTVSQTVADSSELSRIDWFMRTKTRRSDQRAYCECLEGTPDGIQAELQRLTVEQKFSELDERSELRLALQDRIDTFSSVVVIVTFFLPPQFAGPSIRKVWGALQLLLDIPWPEGDDKGSSLKWKRRQKVANSTLSSARKAFRGITRQIILFQQIMAHCPVTKSSDTKIPHELLQAFIYFLLALAHGSVNTNLHHSRMSRFSSLLQDGMRMMLKSFSPASLLTYSSILPTDALSLISLRLFNNLTGRFLNISGVYSECLKKLVSLYTGPKEPPFLVTTRLLTPTSPRQEYDIEINPALAHQEKIQRLFAEINVITDTLEKQKSIFSEIMEIHTSSGSRRVPPPPPAYYVTARQQPPAALYHSRYDSGYERRRPIVSRHSPAPYYPERVSAIRDRYRTPRTTHAEDDEFFYSDLHAYEDPIDRSQLSALDPGGYRLLLARDCLNIIEQQLAEFNQFKRKAIALQQENTHKTETRKDYHDQAVYAFTIVTVIFLPLSAVSSIFGMNTSDIRNLEQGQYLYWATAVPVTLGVILIGLWWMGELGNAALWLLNHRRRGPAPAMTHRGAYKSSRSALRRRPDHHASYSDRDGSHD
ncbi:hypothetical protein F5Y16DRAFT_372060 [Xylariaceae sp. FL0255]|nr:hypothetical protein F5Y16DRAFT_372060 [Xylariaceae sp. FL0255]